MLINFLLIIKQVKLLLKNEQIKFLQFYPILFNTKLSYNMQFYEFHEINFKKQEKLYNQNYLSIFKLQLVFYNDI